MPAKKYLSQNTHYCDGLNILSFDVGIKNLSYCFMKCVEHTDTHQITLDILDWGIIDLTIPIQSLPPPWNPYLLSHFETMRKAELDSLVNSLDLKDYNTTTKTKSDSIRLIHKHIKSQNITLANKKTCKMIDHIAPIMYHRLDSIDFDKFGQIDFVLIENQPSLRNPTMKTVQILLYSYFTLRKITDNPDSPVSLFMVSANGKTKWSLKYLQQLQTLKKDHSDSPDNDNDSSLDGINSGKKYRLTKQATVNMTGALFDNANNMNIISNIDNWKCFFQQHTKKDDLADSLLQGCAFLEHQFKNSFGI